MKTGRTREDLVNSEIAYARAYEETKQILFTLADACKGLLSSEHRHEQHMFEDEIERLLSIINGMR